MCRDKNVKCHMELGSVTSTNVCVMKVWGVLKHGFSVLSWRCHTCVVEGRMCSHFKEIGPFCARAGHRMTKTQSLNGVLFALACPALSPAPLISECSARLVPGDTRPPVSRQLQELRVLRKPVHQVDNKPCNLHNGTGCSPAFGHMSPKRSA